jgi:hypothetical protein
VLGTTESVFEKREMIVNGEGNWETKNRGSVETTESVSEK